MRLAELEARFGAIRRSRVLGQVIEWHDRLASTQDRVLELARDGAPEGAMAVARVQEGGRGRGGSSWVSPAGGLWVSFLLRPAGRIDRAPELTRMLARSVRDVLTSIHGVAAVVKEPNDVTIGGRKVAGILAEASSRAGEDRLEHVVMGLGLDVSNPLDGSLAQIATRLADHGVDVPLESLLAEIVERFEREYLPE